MDTESAAVYSTLGADPNLGALVELYVVEMSGHVSQLVELIQEKNWKELHTATRHVKGSSCSYGFDSVADVAAKLEEKLSQNCSEEIIREQALELVNICRCLRAGPR